MKKLMIMSLALMFVFSASLAFAHGGCSWCHDNDDDCCPDVSISNNSTSIVKNTAGSLSVSGVNSAKGWMGANVNTGNTSASASITNISGANEIYAVPTEGKFRVSNGSFSMIKNTALAGSISGANSACGGSVTTGAASSASSIINMTGYNIIGSAD